MRRLFDHGATTMTTSAPEELREHFDHITEAPHSELLDRFRVMREHCPIARSDQHEGFWVVSKYETIIKILREHNVFTSSEGVTIPPLPFQVRGIPTESDRPQHTAYRAVFMPFLTPSAVAAYEPMVRHRVADLLDSFIADGRADWVNKFASRLPGQVVSELFGFSPEEGEQCYRWIATAMEAIAHEASASEQAVQQLGAFVLGALEEARANPGPDLISAIVTYEDKNGDRFSFEECIGLLFTAIAGSLETTVSALASTLLLLDRFPQARTQLIENPTLADAAADEVLRMESPVHCPARTVKSNVEFDGVDFREGERVLLLFASGNYDNDKFPDPNTFRLDRGANSHLAFGHGIHRCVGAPLAKLEIRVALEEVLRRIPDFRVVGVEGPAIRNGSTWGVTSLDIEFTPGSKVGTA